MIICIEGIDGSGKSTQSEMLADNLRSAGKEVLLMSYPDYGSEYGKKIKEYLHSGGEIDVKYLFETYLKDIAKDAEKIRDAGRRGDVVLSRYYTSTIAYQCAQGFNYAEAKRRVVSSELPVPDLMIYLDMTSKDSMYRKMAGGFALDRHERNMVLLDSVREFYYREIDDRFPGNRKWVSINAMNRREDIQQQILKEVAKVAARVESAQSKRKIKG